MMKQWIKNAAMGMMITGLAACGDYDGNQPSPSQDASQEQEQAVANAGVDLGDKTAQSEAAEIAASKGLSLAKGSYLVMPSPADELLDFGREKLLLEVVGKSEECVLSRSAEGQNGIQIEVVEDDCTVEFGIRDESGDTQVAESWDIEIRDAE